MRTTESGSFGPKFFRVFSRRPGEISLTRKNAEIVKGTRWELFADRLTLDGEGIDDDRVAEVFYSQIESYTADVELGSPFGQYLVRDNKRVGWSQWQQRRDVEYFIMALREGRLVEFSLEVPEGEDDVFVQGKIHSVSDNEITLAGGAVKVDHHHIVWVSHKLP